MQLIFCHLNSFRRKQVLHQTKKLEELYNEYVSSAYQDLTSYSCQSPFYWALLTHIRYYCSSKLLLKVITSHFASNTTGYSLVIIWGALFRKIQEVQKLFSKSRSCIWEFHGSVPSEEWSFEIDEGESIWEKRSWKWNFTNKGTCVTAKTQGKNKLHVKDAKRLPRTWTGLCKVCCSPKGYSIPVPKPTSRCLRKELCSYAHSSIPSH